MNHSGAGTLYSGWGLIQLGLFPRSCKWCRRMVTTGNNDFNLIVLFAAMCLGIFACLGVLIALLKNQIGGTISGRGICLAFGGSLTLFCLDLVAILSDKFYGEALLLLQLLCMVGFAISVGTLGVIFVRWQETSPSRRSVSVWGIGIVSIAISFLCSNRMNALGTTDVTLLTSPELPGEVKPIDSHFAVSDAGRRISLHYFDLKGDLPPSDFADRIVNNAFPGALIRRKDVDLTANCHGWVFANGEFLVDSRGVSIILEDNGYTRIDNPMEGDVVIYRNAKGDAIHTAVVCARLQDGAVLVESKWGVHQRFVHLPEDQPYSTLIEYYRSSRSGHTIEIRNADGSRYESESEMGG